MKTSPFLTLVLFFVFGLLIQPGLQAQTARDLIKPPALKKGDTIMILAPAGRIKDKTSIDAGIKLAYKWGLIVFLGDHLFTQNHTFAGTDAQRLDDLQKALDDPSIKAIWAARGGYGAVRIVDQLDFTGYKKHPKWIVGFSDITVLHNKLNGMGYQTIHGQMPLTLDLEDPVQKKSIKSLKKALFGKKLKYKLDPDPNNRLGEGKGILVGGNLSIVYSMLGSDTQPETEGKILFLEDVGEALYHIDRMMISLDRAGMLKGLKGLVIGDFRLKKNEGNSFGESLDQIVNRIVSKYNYPVVFGFPAGHLDDNRALIFGRTVELKVSDKNARIKFD